MVKVLFHGVLTMQAGALVILILITDIISLLKMMLNHKQLIRQHS